MSPVAEKETLRELEFLIFAQNHIDMMTKEQHIAYWLKSCEDDEITMHALFESGRYTHSLFFGHLYLEKICKALWIKNNNENTPPFIHNLIKLLGGFDTGLSETDFTFLDDLNKYQLSGRYLNIRSLYKDRQQKISRFTVSATLNKSAYAYEKKSDEVYIRLPGGM